MKPGGRGARAIAAALAAASIATPAAANGWGTTSSIGRDVLVVAALGVPAVNRDWMGDLQAAASIGAAAGLSLGLKHAFPEERPDRSDDHSFPSGHAAASFAAAATLENRYGWKAGLPAVLIATLVDVGRVKADKHYWYDVLAGSALGTASGFLLTRKRDQNTRLVPWAGAGGGGMALVARF